jgi:hypothetical protein
MTIQDVNPNLKSKLGLGTYDITLPNTFLPKPTANEYRLGFLYRYIVAKVNMTEIVEVSNETFSNVTSPLFKKAKFKWKISGQLTSTYSGNMLLQEGVIDFNRKQVKDVDSDIPGTASIFTNYKQFYQA